MRGSIICSKLFPNITTFPYPFVFIEVGPANQLLQKFNYDTRFC